jgi:hypothetical protein
MKDVFLRRLVAGVPKVLETFDSGTGRFMTPGYGGLDLGWAVTNQDVMYPLALLYKTAHPENPYHGDRKILDVVSKAGSAVRDWQYPDGQVEFIKVDGSKWGPTYMPWTQFHWVEAYRLVRDDLDAGTRGRWQEGLRLALDGTARQISKDWRVHNIPAWHGMTLVRAAQVFDHKDWGEAGAEMIRRVVAAQTPHGYWAEHGGPTTSYNLVYLHAIGLYHAFTGDDGVLECLRRGLEFHLTFTYPDGSMVETVDGRVKYHKGAPDRAFAGYSLFEQGRRFVRFLMQQAERAGQFAACTPATASAYGHYAGGRESPIPQDEPAYQRTMGDMARVVREGKWFSCVSAMTVEPDENRWGMDRQSFVSLYHDDVGLLVGGGNSKDQPAWSNFLVGDSYLPVAGGLRPGGVELDYRAATCSILVEHAGSDAILTLSADLRSGAQDVQCRLPVHIVPGSMLRAAGGQHFVTDGRRIRVTGPEAQWIGGDRWRIDLPGDATFEYPISPFNPYAKDGAAPLDQAAGFVHAPLSASAPQRVFRVRVGG